MRKKHLQAQTMKILLRLVIPLTILAICLFIYTSYRSHEYNTSLIKKTEESVIRSVSNEISGIQSETMKHIHKTDFLFFSNSSTASRVTYYATNLSQDLLANLSHYDMVKGIILYNSSIDRYFNYFSNKIAHPFTEEFKPYLHTETFRRSTISDIIILDGYSYIVYVVKQRYGAVAVIIDPSQDSAYRTFLGLYPGDVTFLFSEEASALDNSFISMKLDDYPVYLAYQNEEMLILTGTNRLQLFFLICIIVLFVFTIISFLYLQRLLLRPLQHLADSFQIISTGNKDYRIKNTSEIYEISQFYKGFNEMLDHIRQAQEETYRYQMDAVQAKLQYLQLQIRPHFYLNCLKNINALAEIHEDEKIQDLVLYLSDYFRYNFQDFKNFVTIREEFESIQSYINVCRCLYHEIELEYDVESDVLPLRCLPLTVLTFVENCIKHGKGQDQLLIRIHSSVEVRRNQEVYIQMRIENTGSFTEPILQELNHADNKTMLYQRNKVGIANIRYRLWLIYGDHFSISFENKDNLAVVSLLFPDILS